MNKQEPFINTGKKSLLNWIEHMDAAFIDAMVQQQEKGNRLHGNFTSQAYANMVEELNKKLNMNLTKSHLKNHLKTLKSGFSQWYDMFNEISLSEFGWNVDTQLIEAYEQVWDNLLKFSVHLRYYLVYFYIMLLIIILIYFGVFKQLKPEAVILKTKKVAHFEQMLVFYKRYSFRRKC